MSLGAEYVWQHAGWPRFSWNSEALLASLGRARQAQGRLLQALQSVGFEADRHSQADVLAEETLKTAAIEGETFELRTVRSSVARRLGLSTAGLPPQDRRVEGLVDVLQDAVRNHASPLTASRLKGWQASLFPGGYSGLRKIRVGDWRAAAEPMRVVSGTARREVIHFEAPTSAALPSEMKRFLAWWNGASKASDGLLRAGLAHFYFVTLHPFDDGNGRVARALTDMALAQDERSAIRYYSLSARIHSERDGYYEALESAQRGGLDVTDWLLWFLACFERAVGQAQETTSMALGRAELGRRVSALSLSDRQRKVLAKLIGAGPAGFEGGLTTRKYVAMTGASRATAFREIDELVRDHLLLPRSARGRSQAYDLIWPAPGEAKG